MPMPAAQAAAEPDMAAMTMLAAIAALERPPQRCPRHTRPKPKRLFEIPPTDMRFPIRRKNGMDMSVIHETWANIRCGTRKSRETSPPAKRKVAIEANPIVTAVVAMELRQANKEGIGIKKHGRGGLMACPVLFRRYLILLKSPGRVWEAHVRINNNFHLRPRDGSKRRTLSKRGDG